MGDQCLKTAEALGARTELHAIQRPNRLVNSGLQFECNHRSGWMYVLPLVLFIVARGRDYYLAPAYPMLLSAGAVWAEQHLALLAPRAQTAALRAAWISLAIGGLVSFALVIPIAPIGS